MFTVIGSGLGLEHFLSVDPGVGLVLVLGNHLCVHVCEQLVLLVFVQAVHLHVERLRSGLTLTLTLTLTYTWNA